MKIISDLHIHGKYSQATSKDLTIQNLEKYARIKGVNLLGTGDFTHPLWIKELKNSLSEDSTGILKTRTGFPFLLQTEISLVYSQAGKGRRVHNIVFAPNFDVVAQITEYLLTKGRIDYDGRPIFKIPCPEFVESLRHISPDIEVIPAHCWTPWFSMFGSNSGFNSVEECFQDQSKNIHAFETGLSSDPPMNWRLSQLDRYSIVSFSDSHSFWPWRIGREATVFDLKELSYKGIIGSLRSHEVDMTIEVDPSYGKYHYDGHRNCSVCLSPVESRKLKGICPKCGKPLTIGVAARVEELADREEGFMPGNAKPFKSIIPLSELIAAVIKSPVASKKVWGVFNALIAGYGNEFDVLLNAEPESLSKVADEKIIDAVIRNRNMQLRVRPGYDGVYGVPMLDEADFDVRDDILKPAYIQKGLDNFFS